MNQPVKRAGRLLPTLVLLFAAFYVFTDPQGAATAFKAALTMLTTGAHQLAEFIRAASQ